MLIEEIAETPRTFTEYDIHADAAQWTSEAPAPVFAQIPVDVYFGTIASRAWIAFPNDVSKRKDSMQAQFADGAFGAWHDKRITRAGIPDDATPSKISIPKRKRLVESTNSKVTARIRDAVEILEPLVMFHAVDLTKGKGKRSFYEIAEDRQNEDNANFYKRRLRKLLPVAHLAWAFGRFGLPDNDVDVLNILNFAEVMRRKTCDIPSEMIDTIEIVQFRPVAVEPGTAVKFG
ncbi:hypothetical protein [Hyphococcus sp.]|uniref:hypothetical protein n=1 Tax=Hyphococcus sp. TaxID=2038636 RepID=UPI0035C6ED7B